MISVLAWVRAEARRGISPVNWYRAYGPLTWLQEKRPKNFHIQVFDREEVMQMTVEQFEGWDIYFSSRFYSNQGLNEFVNAIHGNGGKIVFDTDDDLSGATRAFERGDEFQDMLARGCDLVTVSTPYLADVVAQYTDKPIKVLPNHLDIAHWKNVSLKARRDPQITGISVGLVGTSSHQNDWIYPVEALNRLALEYEDRVTIVVGGFFPDYLKDIPNCVAIQPMQYHAYPKMVRQFDIVCCALDPDDKFNLSKSAIKSLESMAAARVLPSGKIGGAVPVCTNMPVYRRAVNHRHNGLLVENTDWYEALKLLIEDEQLRTKLSIQGHKWVCKNRDLATGCLKWGKVLQDLHNLE